ncbi:zinc finger protein [Parasponia andersonii]|uniref:Zinc finger protein n=1 Tax=Parasponia andersonii TaxID=3476 RepID=A0A2P5AVR8_PARAD|nr:zinc finger protein [Parasponia andersonii]
MGTRSNFYKNPSITYKKDFSLNSVLQNLRAYNAATGAAPSTHLEQSNQDGGEHEPKRRRHCHPKSTTGPISAVTEDKDDRPMSHHDYIQKIRKELSSSQHYQELSADVLGTSSSTRVNLVAYESDESSSSECEEKQDPPNSGHEEELDRVKSRSEQRFPVPGEPVCVICGKFGEYICNETDDDICSIECKAELLEIVNVTEEPSRDQRADASSSELKCTSPMPEIDGDTWDFNQNRWSKKRSMLCSYECWKCQRPGHLAEDCLVMTSNEAAQGKNKTNSLSKDLAELYKRCHQIGRNLLSAQCNACRSSITLATCLDCTTVFCDNAGHLSEHIETHRSHRQFYSHKLRRLVKCCKSTCKVTNINDLLVCHYCFDKAFEKFYDMYSATWKGSGLSMIWGSICCEDHFEWHRMNCLNAGVEDNAYIISRNRQRHKSTQLSDFIF